jgi:hypothetical protein
MIIKLILIALLVTGCAAGSNFKPVTAEGAYCKVQCGKEMASCFGSSYTCDRAASTCMAGCQDLDAIKSK